MADASRMGFVSQSLQAPLRSVTAARGAFVDTPIDLRSPKELRLAGGNRTMVPLWLDRMSSVEDLVNAAPVPLAPITPLAPGALNEQRLRGIGTSRCTTTSSPTGARCGVRSRRRLEARA